MFNRTLLWCLTLALGLLIDVAPISANDIQVGDEVLTRMPASLWRGDQVFDHVPSKTYFKVEQVKGKWLHGTFAFTTLNGNPTVDDVLNGKTVRENPPPVTAWVDSQFVVATKRFKKKSPMKRGDVKDLPPHTKIVAMSGDSAPDNNGLFAFFDSPIMNDQRQVAFGAVLLGTDQGRLEDRGVFIGNEKSLTQIARKGQIMSDNRKIVELGSSYGGWFVTNLNDSGQTSFQAVIGADSRTNTILRGDAKGLTIIADTKSRHPQGTGRFTRFASFTAKGQAINDQGEVVVWGDIDGSQTGVSKDAGIFVGDGTSFRQIVRKEQPVPDTNRFFVLRDGMFSTLNNRGQVALSFSTTDRPNEPTNSGANSIIRSDGHELLKIAQRSQIVSNGDALHILARPVLNHRGHVAFSATLSDPNSPKAKKYYTVHAGYGVYLSQGKKPFELKEIARSGQSAPDKNGRYSNFEVMQINTPSQIGFQAYLSDVKLDRSRMDQLRKYFESKFGRAGHNPATVKVLMDSLDTAFPFTGLFRSEPDSDQITTIVRTGQDSPDGDGFFPGVSNCTLALNDAGQIAFNAGLIATGGEHDYDSGIFFYDDQQGLMVVARTEMPFLGSKISQIHQPTSGQGDDRTCLNAHGQVAFRFTLEDNREGIAIWTAPTTSKP